MFRSQKNLIKKAAADVDNVGHHDFFVHVRRSPLFWVSVEPVLVRRSPFYNFFLFLLLNSSHLVNSHNNKQSIKCGLNDPCVDVLTATTTMAYKSTYRHLRALRGCHIML